MWRVCRRSGGFPFDRRLRCGRRSVPTDFQRAHFRHAGDRRIGRRRLRSGSLAALDAVGRGQCSEFGKATPVHLNASIQRLNAHPGFPRALPFALYMAFIAIAPALHGWQGLDGRWLYGIQISAVVLALALSWSRYEEINRSAGLSAWQWALSILVGATVFVLWINLEQPWLVVGVSQGFDPRQADGALDWPLVVMRIFGAAAVVPIMEELFWRSLLMRWLERADFLAVAPAAVGLRAVVLSSVVFGVEHTLWFAGIVAGIAYALLYRRTGDLWAPIVAHAVTNLLLGIWVVSTGNWRFW